MKVCKIDQTYLIEEEESLECGGGKLLLLMWSKLERGGKEGERERGRERRGEREIDDTRSRYNHFQLSSLTPKVTLSSSQALSTNSTAFLWNCWSHFLTQGTNHRGYSGICVTLPLMFFISAS